MAGATGSALAEAYLLVRADQSKLASDLSSVRSAFVGSIQEMSNVAAGILGAIGVTSLMEQVLELGKAFVTTNAQLETYITSLGVMLKSEAKAAKLMDDIRAMAAKTPFDVAGLTQAAQSLLGVGIAAQNVLPMLTKLGDAAAASTKGMAALPRLIKAITDMRSKSKIGADDMKQIAELGIPAWNILAKAMGKTTAEVQALSKAGKLGMDAVNKLIEGLGNNFPGMMNKLSKTWSGMIETLKDNSKIAIQAIGEPLFNAAKDALTGMLAWLDSSQVQAGIQKLREGMRSLVDTISDLAKNPIAVAIAKFAGLTAVIAGLVSTLGVAYIAYAAIAPVLAPIIALSEAAAASILLLKAAWDNALTSPGGQQLLTTLGEIKTLAIEIVRNVREAFSGFFTWLSDKWNAVFGNELAGKQAALFQDLFDFIKKAMDWVSLLTTNFSMSWDYIYEYFSMKLNEMQLSFNEAWDAIAATFSGVIAGMGATINQFLVSVEGIWGKISDGFGNMVDMMSDQWSRMIAHMKATAAGLAAMAKNPANAQDAFGKAFAASIADADKKHGDGFFVGLPSDQSKKNFADRVKAAQARDRDAKAAPDFAEAFNVAEKARLDGVKDERQRQRDRIRDQAAGLGDKEAKMRDNREDIRGLRAMDDMLAEWRDFQKGIDPDGRKREALGDGKDQDGGKKAQKERKVEFVKFDDLSKKIQQGLGGDKSLEVQKKIEEHGRFTRQELALIRKANEDLNKKLPQKAVAGP